MNSKIKLFSLSLIAIIFGAMHIYTYYFCTSDLLTSWVDPEFVFENIVLVEEKQPNYFSPLQKIEYQYAESGDELEEVVLIERQESRSSHELEVVFGDANQYYNAETDGISHGIVFCHSIFVGC